jgi:hypothetical protein
MDELSALADAANAAPGPYAFFTTLALGMAAGANRLLRWHRLEQGTAKDDWWLHFSAPLEHALYGFGIACFAFGAARDPGIHSPVLKGLLQLGAVAGPLWHDYSWERRQERLGGRFSTAQYAGTCIGVTAAVLLQYADRIVGQ